ncbi:MAG: hypothetical protein CR984_05650 [Proteobacteria bacterium]|nr:MAG: hypothetical protein CR984_05650 [Pseudomonadota bacterium]
MDKKYGVYICEGCGIGESLDVKALCGVPEEEGVPVKTHPFLCGKEGVDMLKKDIADGTNTLVLGACSRRVNFDIFRFDGCIVDRVNLREGVVWSHPRSEFPALTEEEKEDEDNYDRVQMMAEDYIRMGMIRVEKINLPEPYVVENLTKKILVLGGGITGMTAALDAAAAGFDVTIIEKTAVLGGYAAKVRSQMPVSAPYDALVSPVVADKIAAVEANSNITVKTETEVARIAGQPGEFTVTLKKPGEKIPFDVPFPLPEEMKVDADGKELDVDKQHEAYLAYNEGKNDILQVDSDGEMFGAVILAAGWRPDDLSEGDISHLGYGELPNVVTNAQFEEIAKAGKIIRPSDGKPAKSVVFVQSPGKDESDGDFAYAGAVTSMVALKQAKYVREDYEADGKAFIFYQHIFAKFFLHKPVKPLANFLIIIYGTVIPISIFNFRFSAKGFSCICGY